MKQYKEIEDDICNKGLFPYSVDKLSEFPTELHKYCGKGIGIWQYPKQFAKYVQFLSTQNIETYLEIGIAAGGTFQYVTSFLKDINPDFKGIGIDPAECGCTLRGGENMYTKQFRDYIISNDFVQYHSDFSKNIFKYIDESQIFDLIFIDGDHSYDGVKSDFELLKNNGRILVFHDIVNDNCPGVRKFWSEIKEQFETIEFIDQYEGMDKKYLGIGIVFNNINIHQPKYGYMCFGNRPKDLTYALVLASSLRKHNNYNHKFNFIYFNETNESTKILEENSHIIKKLNINILKINNPINKHLVKNKNYYKLINNLNLWWDFYKLHAFCMITYTKIMFLDADMMIDGNIEHLFEYEHDFVYSDGPGSPVNSGMFICKPNLLTYKKIQQFVLDGNFDMTNGWNNNGITHRTFNAIYATQGIFYYFFVYPMMFNVLKVERSKYNHQGMAFCDCNIKPLIYHFTGWGKPSTRLIYPKNDPRHDLHLRWHEYLKQLHITCIF